ncbi:MAG: hypothetical protein ACKO26_15565 [Planctomycetota bacterium]
MVVRLAKAGLVAVGSAVASLARADLVAAKADLAAANLAKVALVAVVSVVARKASREMAGLEYNISN